MPRAPVALFESWRGRYADSPRELSRRLGDVRPDVRRVWVGDDGMSAPFPDDVRVVRRHSPAYFARLLSCDLLVANDIVTKQLVKGPRVTYVQTWHGTPLKLLGHDETKAAYAGHAAHMRRVVRDVRHWDALVSPSAECTRLLRSAFRYDGEVWETGYPRNDPLSAPDAPVVRDRVRAELGLRPGERAVLWAPTWRDDVRDQDGRLAMEPLLDPVVFERLVPEGTRLLVRMHKNVAHVDRPRGSSVVEVSDYPDITELYLAADALVSDYSSAVFDFAVTAKPVLLHVPDLETYRDRTRGMYFDYESWAPGPLSRSTEELADLVSRLDAVARTHADRLDDFRRRFCPHDDGHATERVLDRLLSASGV